MKQRNWIEDKSWADRFLPTITEVLRLYFGDKAEIKIAPELEDCTEATDYIVTTGKVTIACRIRMPDCRYRDFTIRSWRQSGVQTELEKLRKGFADYYLYAWSRNNLTFDGGFILVDMNKVRSRRILDGTYPFKKNPDGISGFISIPLKFLLDNNCVLLYEPTRL
jgi:hypothetical protein